MRIESVETLSSAIKTRRAQLGLGQAELAPLYDAVSTTLYPDLTDKLSMKIGRHYEIEKVTQNDFSLLTDTLGIKVIAVRRIFADFRSHLDKAFETLKSDEKISAEVLDAIQDGVRGRLDRLGI